MFGNGALMTNALTLKIRKPIQWAISADIPFCVAGGIRSVENAALVLSQGADKISINTPALERPGLINDLVRAFGSQCVVIGVDSIADGGRSSSRSTRRAAAAAGRCWATASA